MSLKYEPSSERGRHDHRPRGGVSWPGLRPRHGARLFSMFLSLSLTLSLFLSRSLSLYFSLALALSLFLSLSRSLYVSLALSLSLYLSPPLSISISISLSLAISLSLCPDQTTATGSRKGRIPRPCLQSSILSFPLAVF